MTKSDGILIAVLAAALAALFLTGRLEPAVTLDTESYLVFGSFTETLGQSRNPLYGWLLYLLTFGRLEYGLIPAIQTALYFLAVLHWSRSLRRLEITPPTILAFMIS